MSKRSGSVDRSAALSVVEESDQILLCSMLMKKSPKGFTGMKAWQLRYFALYEDKLVYRRDNKLQSPILGAIPINFVVSAALRAHKGPTRFDIILLGDERIFSLRATNKELATEWVTKINKQVAKVNITSDPAAKLATLRNATINNERKGSLWKSSTSGTLKFWKNPQEFLAQVKAFTDYLIEDSKDSEAMVNLDEISSETNSSDVVETTKYTRTASSRYLLVDTREASSSKVVESIDSSTSKSMRNPPNASQETNRLDLESLKGYQICELLGDGPYGKIYRVKSLSSEKYHLLQLIKKGMRSYERGKKSMKSLNGLFHPFLMNQEETYVAENDKCMWAILTYAYGGPIFGFLRKCKRFHEDAVVFLAAQLALVIEYLHSQNRILRHLAIENVWLDKTGYIMVSDFDLSSVDAEYPHKKVTEFSTPEHLQNDKESFASDWWRFGLFIYEISVGIPPFRGTNSEEISQIILHENPKYPPFISQNTKDIISSLLKKSPHDRLGSLNGMQDIKEHPFFAGVDWENIFEKNAMIVPRMICSLLDGIFEKPAVNSSEESGSKSHPFLSKSSAGSNYSRTAPSHSSSERSNETHFPKQHTPSSTSVDSTNSPTIEIWNLEMTIEEINQMSPILARLQLFLRISLGESYQKSKFFTVLNSITPFSLKENLRMQTNSSCFRKLLVELLTFPTQEILASAEVDIPSLNDEKSSMKFSFESISLKSARDAKFELLSLSSVEIEVYSSHNHRSTSKQLGRSNSASKSLSNRLSIDDSKSTPSLLVKSSARKSSASTLARSEADGSDEESESTIFLRSKAKLIKASLKFDENLDDPHFTVLTSKLVENREKDPSIAADFLLQKFQKVRLFILSSNIVHNKAPLSSKCCSARIVSNGEIRAVPKLKSMIEFWNDMDRFFSEESLDGEDTIACIVGDPSKFAHTHVAMYFATCMIAELLVQGPKHALSFAFRQLGLMENFEPSQIRYLEYFEQYFKTFQEEGRDMIENIRSVHLSQLAINPLPDVEDEEKLQIDIVTFDSQVLFSKTLKEMEVKNVESGARIFWSKPLELTGDILIRMISPEIGVIFSCALHTSFVVNKRFVLRKEDLDQSDLSNEEFIPTDFKIGLYF